MARHEADREDLLREATALRRRVELRVPSESETVVAGFRTDGSLSLYFGQDEAYHFDPAGRLRRAFAGGKLYRTQGDTLAELTRHRTAEATELRRHDLTPAELRAFLEHMRERIERLRRQLVQEQVAVLRQVPEDENLLPELCAPLDEILKNEVPLAPSMRGKR